MRSRDRKDFLPWLIAASIVVVLIVMCVVIGALHAA